MKKTIITITIILAALIGLSLVLRANKAGNEAIAESVASKNATIAVKVATAISGNLSSETPVNGIFIPERDVEISTETPGRVSRVFVKEGDYVKAGQLLAVIKADQQNVSAANAESVYQNAVAELARYQNAYSSGGVTEQQLEQKRLDLANAKNNLKSARINVSDVNVKASFSGIINQRNIEPGSYANPGQVLFDIVDVTSLKLRVNVDEKEVTLLKVGQEIKVNASAVADKEWVGKVSFIAPKAEGNLSFPVELRINNPGNELKAGMYGTAFIGNEGRTESLMIPIDAFVGSVSSNQVYLVKNGKAVLTKVSSGQISGNQIQVFSGIEAGDEVITAGQINLTDGAAIQIIK